MDFDPSRNGPGKRPPEHIITYGKKIRIHEPAAPSSGCALDSYRQSRDDKAFQEAEAERIGLCYTNIPEDIFLKICSFLPTKDVWRLGKVCSRWYGMTRSGTLWERTDLVNVNLSDEKLQQFLWHLPPCVKELRIGSSSNFTTLNVPKLCRTLLERFPQLRVLIIEKSLLANPVNQLVAINGYTFNSLVPVKEQTYRYFSVVEYHPTEVDADFNTLVTMLGHLSVLSLRNSMLPVEFRLIDVRTTTSRIKVLDLTNCPCVEDHTIVQFIQLPSLEELYLAGTAISVNGVEYILELVPNIKVLDLDNTVVGSETFAVLRDKGQKLVEIYLGKTAVRDSDLIDVDESSFPVLKKICLQRTSVSEIGVNKLLLSVRSLTDIFVSNSRVKAGWVLDQPAFVKAKLKRDESEECNHFQKKKLGGKFF